MATQPNFQGLFKGPTQGSVISTIDQERQARIRQAQADTVGSGGNYYAGLIAKANAQMSEALQQGVGNLAQGEGVPGMLKDAMPRDPRLQAAAKREKDKGEIMTLLDGYAADGKITEDELKKGMGELMRRGYMQEAQQFQAMAKSMGGDRREDRKLDQADRGLDINDKSANAALKRANATLAKYSKEGKKERKSTNVLGHYKDDDGKEYTQIVASYKHHPDEIFKVYADGATVNSKGETLDEAPSQAYKIESAKEFAKSKTKLQESVGTMRKGMGHALRALEVLPHIKTGGLALLGKAATDFFGITDKNIGKFNNETGQVLITKIGEFGANPTEGERKFLTQVEAGMAQGNEVNEAILKQIIKIYQSKLDRTSGYLNMNYKQYNETLSQEAKDMSKEAQAAIDGWAESKPKSSTEPPTTTADSWAKVISTLNPGDPYIDPDGVPRIKGKN